MSNEYLKKCAQAIVDNYSSGLAASVACQISEYSIRQVLSGKEVCSETKRRIKVVAESIFMGEHPNPTWKKGDRSILACARKLAAKNRARGKNKDYSQDSVIFGDCKGVIPKEFYGIMNGGGEDIQDEVYELKKIGGAHMIRIAKLGDKSVYCPAIVRADPNATNTQFVIQ